MAGKSTISITFKLDGDGKGFRALAQDANGLKKVLTETISEAQRLNTGAINFAAIATGIGQAQQSIAALQSALKGLTDTYAVQVQAETQLETVMRQRMGASDEDVQAIKNLASAQQELGVIGDEVQLSGAQQMATFLTQRQSIETLLPAMNNLLAQQKGLNATTSDAVTVGNLMGKAMQGQTAALRRVGITFDESQEKIMKYGTEAQRAAMLAQIIQQNVGDMNAQLAATDAGKQKQLDNTLGDIKEKLGGLVQGAMPFVTITANTMLALAGVIKFAAGVKAASAAVAGWNIKNKIATALLRLSGLSAKQAAVGVNVLSSAHKSAAVSAHLLKGAIHGLMIATGVGIIIAGLTSVIEYFSSKSEDASDSTHKLLDAEERAKAEAERLEQMRQQETATLENTRAALQINIQTLKNFNGTKAEEKKLVGEMNDTYGETMGYFSSVSDWYEALIANSEDYCRQMVLEARTRTLANQIAQKEQANHDILYNSDGTRKRYKTYNFDSPETQEKMGKQAQVLKALGEGSPLVGLLGVVEGQQVNEPTEAQKAQAAYDQNRADIKSLTKQLEDTTAEVSKLTFSAQGSKDRPNLTNTTPSSGQEAKDVERLNKLIEAGREEYLTASEARRAEIQKNIAAWTAELRAIETTKAAASRPTELKTLQDIDDEIAYQQTLRKYASVEQLGNIDAEIARLGKLRNSMEQAAHVPTPIDQIDNYEDLNRELAYLNKQLQTANANEREAIQLQIIAANKKKQAMDAALDELDKPGDISTLNTLEDIEKAISYYEARQKRASGDEIAENAKVIASYYRKRDALKRGIDIVDMKSEADAINSLTGREYKVKIRSMGFDELTAKIAELQKALNDTENPLTTAQRKDIEDLIGVYERWRSEVVNTFDTYRDGYNGLKNVGSGVQSITDALEGNGNAWQKVTAIINGFLEVYDGISAIVGIINMLINASQTHTAAKTAEAAAVVVATGAQAAEAPIADAAAAAQTPVIAANEAAAASYMKMASAAFFAAHAYIPFAGFGIAAGFTAAAAAIVSAVGKVVATPFAEGGIVTGPTLGYIGEYAGASNNPEVVAPLDKLRTLIEPRDAMAGHVEFEIDGRKLRGVLQRVNNVSNRS